jgi:two-component system phosphate regulon sensor histidine kinase PhoR
VGLTCVYLLGTAIVVTVLAALISYVRARERSRRIRALIELTHGLLDPTLHDHPLLHGDDISLLERSLSLVEAEVRAVVDRLKIEASLREAILSSIGEGVLAVDKDLRVIFCNDAMIRTVGARRPIRDRLPLLELVRDAEVQAMLSEVIRSGTNSRQSLKVDAANSRSFEVYAAPLEAVSGPGAIAIFHDITALERLEQVRKDFIANVSHEMRTPLASVIAYSDTLLEGALEEPPMNRRFIEVIRSNAVRLNNISADLLILSELESGANPKPVERVSAREVLESVLKTIETEARSNDVKIIPGAMKELFVMGHRFRLEQALLNLLANAVKFNRPGGEVHVGVQEDENGGVQIDVSDTGIGIPSEDLPRIFERFYRVDKARSRQVGGTGLGLSITKHVIEGMLGKITAESHLGKGSHFTIILPAAPPVS